MKGSIFIIAFISLVWPNIVLAKNYTMGELKFQVDCTSLAIISAASVSDNPNLRKAFPRSPFLIIDKGSTFKKWSDLSWKTAVELYEQDLDDEEWDYVTSSDYENFMNPIQKESMDRLVAEMDRDGSFDKHYEKLAKCVAILGK